MGEQPRRSYRLCLSYHMFPLFVNFRRPHGAAFSFALFGAGIAQRLRAVADPCGGWINNDRQYRQHHRHKLHRVHDERQRKGLV